MNTQNEQISTGKRALYMVFYAFIWSVGEVVLGAVALLQLLFVFLKKQPNDNLLGFGRSLSEFLYQIASFVTFNSDDRPFPFGAWPTPDKQD